MRPTPPTRPFLLHVTALALSALAGATGCFQVSEEVRVRDPHQVSVVRADGTVSLPAGELDAAVHQEGELGRPFLTTPYRVIVERDAEGSIALHCDACMDAWWARGSHPTLVTADGILGPSTSARFLSSRPASTVTIGAEEVHLHVPSCLLQAKRCQVPVEALLSTPRENVLEIRRRRAPVPAIGALLLGFGAVPLATGVTVAAGGFPRSSTPVRAVVATPMIAAGVTFSSIGIWHLAAPAQEQVIHLGPAGE
jgi:hypothetical protein